ncbi:MAG: GNAT family N-acetyltransferase [Bacteroidetes bacterium]|nr:GNAT family N-acetyltransferase [Bacteroidota bacterium]
MESQYKTPRLILNPLTQNDHEFVTELVNSPEWLKFISSGKSKTDEEVTEYIEKINNTPMCTQWAVRLKDSETPIGAISFKKRDILEYYDLGFAFLTRYGKQGYAFEAAKHILSEIEKSKNHTHVLAITLPENENSIRLIEKLGFSYKEESEKNDEKVLVYSFTMS